MNWNDDPMNILNDKTLLQERNAFDDPQEEVDVCAEPLEDIKQAIKDSVELAHYIREAEKEALKEEK